MARLAMHRCMKYQSDTKDFSGEYAWANGKFLCSECCPPTYSDGSSTEFGKWHGEFPKEKATKVDMRAIQVDPKSWCWSNGMEKLFEEAKQKVPNIGLMMRKPVGG